MSDYPFRYIIVEEKNEFWVCDQCTDEYIDGPFDFYSQAEEVLHARVYGDDDEEEEEDND
jgi:hypothetical protein